MPLIVFSLIGLIVACVFSFRALKKHLNTILPEAPDIPEYNELSENKHKICLLCKTIIESNKSIKISVYPQQKENPKRMVDILGCPLCYPQNRKAHRDCPVCKGRLFETETGIGYLHEDNDVYRISYQGCTQCFKPNRLGSKIYNIIIKKTNT